MFGRLPVGLRSWSVLPRGSSVSVLFGGLVWSLVLLVSLAFSPPRRPLFSCPGFVFLGACLLLGVLAGFSLGLLPAGFSFSFEGLLPFGICCFPVSKPNV